MKLNQLQEGFERTVAKQGSPTFLAFTPRKFKIAFKWNRQSQKETHLPTMIIEGLRINYRGIYMISLSYPIYVYVCMFGILRSSDSQLR